MTRLTFFLDSAGRVTESTAGHEWLTVAGLAIQTSDVDSVRRTLLPNARKWSESASSETSAAINLALDRAIAVVVLQLHKEQPKWREFWRDGAELHHRMSSKERSRVGFVKPATVIRYVAFGDCSGPLLAEGIVNLLGPHTVCQSCDMSTPPATQHYKNHRFPVEVISHAVWLYFRFCLSFRDVEELLLERGVVVTYEAIRKWCRKFGQQYANRLRRRRPRPGDKWQMDEVFLTIQGERHYLWRAVDQEGNVLDILVRRRRV